MDKLEGIKPGDRVRVTFEGEVLGREIGGDVYIRANGAQGRAVIRHGVASAPGFGVEVIKKPLAVGDRVKEIFAGLGKGEILCVDGEHAFVRWDVGAYGPSSILLSNLERLS